VKSEWQKPLSIGFIGRFDEPRKGLAVLLKAWHEISRTLPELQLLVAGPGDEREFQRMLRATVDSNSAKKIKFLGKLSETEKSQFFHSISTYIAPNTGGESFGIILVEAMASGTPIIASDLEAFSDLLTQHPNEFGSAGLLFDNENSDALAQSIIGMMRNSQGRDEMKKSALAKAEFFDWSVVGTEILEIYELAMTGNGNVRLASDNRLWNRWKS
jgi:phosphatidylinositol alpha-mannosyltransferase